MAKEGTETISNVVQLRDEPSVPAQVSPAEWQPRVDLAAVCKLQLLQQAAGNKFTKSSKGVLDQYAEQRKIHNVGHSTSDCPGFLRRLNRIAPSYAE